MSIVVTGAAGFLAGTLLPALSAAGHDTVGIDRLPFSAADQHLACELTEASPEALDAIDRADAVIHLAGCPGVRDSSVDVVHRRQRDNVDATRAVLEATALNTPVIALSSSSVYGGAPGDPFHVHASHEDDRLVPRGGYAASKVAAEQVCRERVTAGGHVLVVRPFTVLGEGQREDMAVARWAVEARATGGVTVLGSAERTRDFTDVRDVARALIALLDSGAVGTVNVGTGHRRSLAHLAEAVCAAVGVAAALRTVPAAASEVPHTRADTRRLRSLVGFMPQTDLHDVVARSVASLDRRARADTESYRVGA